jgi:hypothetical protein
MGVLMNLALAVTRAIDPKRLYDWMIAITKAVDALPSSIGVGPFATVARASSSRMLDVTVEQCTALQNGAEVWVDSFGGGHWFWDVDFPAGTATDNETTCRPTAWAAAAGPPNGAFVRDLSGNRTALAQTAWFVDSTAADNEGTGLTGDRLKTDVEIQRRWGISTRARLAAASVAITYAQSPAATTNFYAEVLNGTTVDLHGTPTVTKAGTVLTAVQAQVRTAGAETGWAVTGVGLGAADVAKIMVITASGTAANVGAYASILKDETGGKVRVSPFGKYAATTTPFTQVTPQIGDTIEVRDMSSTTLTIGTIEFVSASETNTSGVNATTYVAFHQVKFSGNPNSFAGGLAPVRLCFFYDRCQFEAVCLSGNFAGGIAQHRIAGGVGASPSASPFAFSVRAGAGVTCSQVGFINAPNFQPGCTVTLSADCYFQNCSLTVGRGCAVVTQGVAMFDRAIADASITTNPASSIQQTGAVPDWGTANLGHGVVCFSGGQYVYATKPTVNGGLGAGREARVGGTDKLYSAVPYVEGANNAALVLNA